MRKPQTAHEQHYVDLFAEVAAVVSDDAPSSTIFGEVFVRYNPTSLPTQIGEVRLHGGTMLIEYDGKVVAYASADGGLTLDGGTEGGPSLCRRMIAEVKKAKKDSH